MSSFASIRPRLSGWRGWLPPLALPLFMFAALLALGGDRGYFYRPHAGNYGNTIKRLAIVKNLSVEHNFLIAHRIWRSEDGGFGYHFHGRFPVGGYALVKLAVTPFWNDLAATLLAARVLMMLMFCGAAAFAFLAFARIAGSRPVAAAVTLLAFSGMYAVRYADSVNTEGVMDLFGAALVFHGMAAFVQEGRFRQLAVKTCAALLVGWHVYALLLPFIALGFGGEAAALIRSARASGDRAKAARAAITALARSRYVSLAAIAISFGSALLAFNLANEYAAGSGGTGIAAYKPTYISIARRFGQTDDYTGHPDLEWGRFIKRQLYRAGVASVPYSLVRAAGYDFPTDENGDPPLAPAVLGAAATVAALGALALARRRRILTASAVLFGFCWAIPMRYSVFLADHAFESLPYIFLTLALFALAFSGARRLLGGRVGERLSLAVCAAAAVVFALSVFHAGRQDERLYSDAGRDKSEMADFSAISERTRGERVVAFPRHRDTIDDFRYLYYLGGSYWETDWNSCDPRAADFVVGRYRHESLNLLTPDNRIAFLYEDTAPLELCRAERRQLESSEPTARAAFDLYLQDGALNYLKAPCEQRDYETAFFAYVHPADPNDLRPEHRRNGFYPMWWGGNEFAIKRLGAAFDGACVVTLPLPDYPISSIRTGQAASGGETVWEASINPPPNAEALAFYERTYQAIASSGAPAARSGFDLYLDRDGDTLSYLKAPCNEDDARGRFFLSVHPVDVEYLPAARRALGHDNLNFTFAPPAGVVFDGKCMSTRRLPDYDIERIETGQWIPGGDELWKAEIAVGD